MKNKVNQRSFAILALLLSSATGSMAHGDLERVAGVPENLTLSQMPMEGYNLWTNSMIGAPGEVAQKKLVNRNSLIKEAAHHAQDAYDLYIDNKAGNDLNLPADATPFYFGGEAEGFVSFQAGQNGQKGKIVVAFRGTKEGWDWGTNVNGLIGNNAHMYGSAGTVHYGFHERYMSVRADIHAAICKLQGQHGIDSDISITGHSLGGASASLAAADIKQNIHSNGKLKLVTFNSPRVFDTKSAEDVTKLIGEANMIRIWREKDPVSMVGMGLLGYKHVGTAMKLDETDSSYLMSWERKVVPNHMHSANIAGVNGDKAILPKDHKGIMTEVFEVADSIAQTSVGQTIAEGYNVVADTRFGQAIGTMNSAISGVVSDAKNFVKPYARTAFKATFDHVLKPVVSTGLAGIKAVNDYVVKPIVDNVIAPVVNTVNEAIVKPVVNTITDVYNSEQAARAQNIVTEEAGRIYRSAERTVSDACNAVADAASNVNKTFWGYFGY